MMPAMRRAGLVASVACAVGCCPTLTPLPPAPACVDGTPVADAGVPRACDAPTEVDPAAVTTRAELEAAASILVCDLSLRCPGAWLLAQSFCHPGFAALHSRRAGVAPDAPYDAEAGRACLEALLAAPSCDHALADAFTCLELIDGRFGRTCETDAFCGGAERCDAGRCVWRRAGDACAVGCVPGGHCGLCGPGLFCDAGVCAPVARDCTRDDDCDPWLVCADGRCAGAGEGEACTSKVCGNGLVCPASGVCTSEVGPGETCCGFVGFCDVGVCLSGACAPVGHIGCPCSDDRECPWDVSQCIDGTCVARPMPGEPCATDGAQCFGSICADGACRGIHAGEGPCGHDLDCDPGLSCVQVPTGHCARLLAENEACVPDALDAMCGSGLFCASAGSGSRCEPRAAIGEPCSATLPCVETVSCDPSTLRCVAR